MTTFSLMPIVEKIIKRKSLNKHKYKHKRNEKDKNYSQDYYSTLHTYIHNLSTKYLLLNLYFFTRENFKPSHTIFLDKIAKYFNSHNYDFYKDKIANHSIIIFARKKCKQSNTQLFKPRIHSRN